MPSTRTFLTGTAASLALVASVAAAQPGGNGNGHGNAQEQGKPQQGKPQQGKQPQAKQSQAKSQQARPQQGMQQQARPPQVRPQQTERYRQSTVAYRKPRQDMKRVSYTIGNGRRVIVPTNDRVRVVTRERVLDWSLLNRRVSYNGCPPGLAKKYNGCMPPGLARTPTRNWARPNWYWSDYNRTYTYRYVDGYMVRLGTGSSILSYIPLLAGALAVGNVWPGTYSSVALPEYYDSYYGLGSAGSYRYYGDTIYLVDPASTRINSVAAVLTGNDIVVGQAMPVGYDVYNVPYGYRDQYYDTPDALYRYSDGYVYQLDPTTRLVQAAIELLI